MRIRPGMAVREKEKPMSNFCRNCGNRLPAGALFCPVCGTKVEQGHPAQVPPYANKPQPQPQRPAQVPPYANKPQPQPQPPAPQKKKRSILPIAALAVAAVVAVTVVSGLFSEPGDPGDPGRPTVTAGSGNGGGKSGSYAGVQEPDENAALSQVDPDKLWLPPEPEDIVLDYNAEELAKAPETVMQVGPEKTSAENGDFAVDFGSWNLIEEDTFSIRELPVRAYEKKGYAVQTYDLSLASGRTKFIAEVKVTIPRGEKDGEEVMFLTKDPETGKNAEEYFEISEDGRSYLLYTTHFSDHSKVIISDFGKNFSKAIRTGDITGQETREALSAFYYPTRVPWNERMTAPVRFSPYDLWSKIMGKYTYLPSSCSLMGAAAEKIRSDTRKTIPEEVDLGGLLIFDTDELKQMSKDSVTGVDQLNNARSIFIEPGIKALDKLSLEQISPGFKEMIHNSAESDFFTYVSAITTCVGFALTNEKAIKELEDGKYSTYSEAFWGNWRDYAGVVVGGIGLVGAVIVSTPVTVFAGFGGLSLYFISKSYETPYDDLAGAERNYREYYTVGGAPRRFYFDEPLYANNAYGYNGAVGNIRPLKTMTDAQNQQLKKLINEELKKIHGMGGLRGEDTRSKKVNPEWYGAVTFITEILKNEPEKIGPAVQEFYWNYTQACWDMGDGAFMDFSRTAMKARNENPALARLPEQEGFSKEKYSEILLKELFIKHQDMFLDLAKVLEHEEQIAVNKMIRTELVPLLNTQMEFTVKDHSLKDPSEFKKSVFNKELKSTGVFGVYETDYGRCTDYSKSFLSPMNFCVKNQNGEYEHVSRPVFMPSVNYSKDVREFDNYVVGLSLLKGFYYDYYPGKKNFLPAFTDKKGNVVFRCTFFHYLMMGAPTAMAFRDVDEKDGGEIIVPFEIPGRTGSDGKLHVNIEVKPGEGVWELEKLVYLHNMHYEAEGRDLSGLSPEERAKEIKKNLFSASYSDTTITADPDGYVIDRDVRGGDPVSQGAPHSERRLPGAGGTKEELISAIRSTGTQVRYKVLPSDEQPSTSLDNIPVPKAGGNRRLCINYSDVVLVYREAGGAKASKTAWEHVDENAFAYWKREVLGEK